jgi:GNAT superfamily N-acetyltransferase
MSVIITKKRKGPYLILEYMVADRPVSRLLAVYPDWDTSCMLISSLDTEKEYRSRGYASALLKRSIWEAQRNGCKTIKLDDCSDAFGDDAHNIYVRHGFKYYYEDMPEMKMDI